MNPKVVTALHDKGARITLKMFHKGNKSIVDHKTALRERQDPSKVDGMASVLETVWSEPQDVFGMMVAVHTYCITEHRIRP